MGCKVAVVGSFSVGKTRLAEHISKKYNLPLVSEFPRNLFSDEISHFEQEKVYYEQYEKELKIGDVFVTDGHLITPLAYAAAKGDVEIRRTLFSNVYLCGNSHYDLILYLFPSIPIKEDGNRYIDPEFQGKVDFFMRLYLLHRENVVWLFDNIWKFRVEIAEDSVEKLLKVKGML